MSVFILLVLFQTDSGSWIYKAGGEFTTHAACVEAGEKASANWICGEMVPL